MRKRPFLRQIFRTRKVIKVAIKMNKAFTRTTTRTRAGKRKRRKKKRKMILGALVMMRTCRWTLKTPGTPPKVLNEQASMTGKICIGHSHQAALCQKGLGCLGQNVIARAVR